MNIQYQPDAASNIKDLPKPRGRKKAIDPPQMPDLFSPHLPTALSDLPCPVTDIWSPDQAARVIPPVDTLNEDAPPHIFGDLEIMEPLMPVSQPPPFVIKD